MISLTRLSGTTFLLNADLIERVDCTPDTVVTLVDGTKYIVAESLDEVRDAVIDYRAAIVAAVICPMSPHSEKKIAANETSAPLAAGSSFLLSPVFSGFRHSV